MSAAGTITPAARNAAGQDTNLLEPIFAPGGIFSMSQGPAAVFFMPHVDGGSSAAATSARPGAGASAAPVVTLTSPNLITNTATQTIEGSTDASFSGDVVSIYANGGTIPLAVGTVQSDGHFSVNVTLPAQGDNRLVASVSTAADGTGTSAAIDEALVTSDTYTNTRSTTVNGLTLEGTTVIQNKGTIVQTGDITIGDSSGGLARLANTTGATYTIAGDFDIGVGSNAASNFNNNGGTLQKTAGNDLATISASFQNGSGAPSQIKIGSGGLAFTGATSSFVGQTISGAGLFEIGGGAATIGASTTISAAAFVIAGAGTSVTLAENLTYGGFLGIQSGTTTALGGNVLTMASYSLSPAFAQQPYTGGASAVAGGTGLVPARTVITASSGGRIVTSGYGGIGNVVLGGALVWNNTGLVTATGTAQFGDASGQVVRFANSTGGTYNLVLDAGIAVGSNAASNFNNNGGTLAKVSGTGVSLVAANFQDGNAAAAKITVKSGTLQFNGSVNNFAAQAVSGAGTFAIGGGGTSTIGAGTTITTAAWTIGKAGTTVTLAQNLTFAGSFSDTNATVLDFGGNSLTLSGAAAFNLGPAGAPLVTGSGKLITSGADTIGGLTLGGSTLFRNNGSVSQTGTITLGDGSNAAAQITDAGSWSIAGDVGIAKGSTAAVFNTGGGTLTKTAGSGTSTIAAAIVNLNTAATSRIEVASGTLDFAGPVTGANAFAIDAGRTLAFEASVAAGSAVSFAGAGGTLLLNDAQDFKGSIAGFGANQKLDLASIVYSAATTTLGFSGSTLTVSDGTRTASLTLAGSYSAASFHLANDTHGGSLVTYG